MGAMWTLTLILAGLVAAGGDAVVPLAAAPAIPEASDGTPEGIDFFESKIRPVLNERCYGCHSVAAQKAKAGLLLDSQDGILKGGETGPAIVPGDPDGSLLMKAIRYVSDEIEMPPEASDQLTPAQVADFETWIKMGAPDPRKGAVVEIQEKPSIDWEQARKHWSWKPITEHAPPTVKDAQWARNPIDKFVLARLEANGLQPAPDADRETLLRRVTFDLIGLPPTAKQLKTFLADKSPRALARVVDRLLASHQYGERWGRHWLDVVRYADSSGCNADFPIPQAWRYRNYVVDSFNADKPYDQFVREQIAGDLLPSRNEKQRQEQLVATGFIALSRRFQAESEKYAYLTLEDTLDTMGRGLMGLSLSCARCHDHKFDPIPTRDYYRLYGIFDSTRYPHPGSETKRHPDNLIPLVPPARLDAALASYKAYQDGIGDLEKQMEKLKKTRPPESEITKFRKVIDAFEAKPPQIPFAFAVAEKDAKQIGNARIQQGGDPSRPGTEAPRGFLEILGGDPLPTQDKTSGRLALAGWLTDGKKNPLTPRVMVNRIWLNHFGEGLVRTPNDFGTRGAQPTHPELLDYLAGRFIKSGWSVKALHREIVLSRAYQMAVIENDEALVKDPGNELLWSFRRRRLDAESIRDALLAVSGDLDPTVGQEMPFPQAPWKFSAGSPFKVNHETHKRSVYQMSQRLQKTPFLELFDGADGNMSIGQRSPTTTPLQALFFMNSEFGTDRAANFAERIQEEADDDRSRVDLAYMLAFSRRPTEEERLEAIEYLGKFEHPRLGWKSYAKALLSSNEFAFLD